MADSSQSAVTPGSSNGKSPAIKDRDCPFCGQRFTSSSLGRHLDLYIKERNPKPPDGKHDLDAIRSIRGNITRRQPRHPARRNGSTPLSSRDIQSHPSNSPSLQNHHLGLNDTDGDAYQTYINRANWQSTGVINDLPPTQRSGPHSYSTRHSGHAKEEMLRKQDYLESRDQAQATELALQELLESLKAARRRAHPSTPFDFNFFELNLPQMYLRCLAPPQSFLTAPSQRPHDLTWTTTAPEADQYEQMRAWLSSKLTDWQRIRSHTDFGSSFTQDIAIGNAQHMTEVERVKQAEPSYYKHLETSFNEWSKLSDVERRDAWQYECARAFAREQERHQASIRKLDLQEQEIQLLKARLDRSSQEDGESQRCLYPLTITRLSKETVNYLPASLDLEFRDHIARWREKLRIARSIQQPLPPVESSTPTISKFDTNGHYATPFAERRDGWQNRNGSMAGNDVDGSELADAPGEVDTDTIDGSHLHGSQDLHTLGLQGRSQESSNGATDDTDGHGHGLGN
ncbi:uncharacterized protein KY384_002669 [Bacidia gigantensis]|uniref:uncharacterized protein n=1 Tax=Bacidia gigantensis TaxID=2732470 RepID=UPI001D0384F5|nr:uncharacterized protein KY384_002669 [Bacidia gigantensis]KAG8532791.1 hypothetical protein KY384_002669 [Bacidia gigantensis]